MPPHRFEYRSTQLAAFILFTTPPTDRALTGWDGTGWVDEELDDLGIPWLQVAAVRRGTA